MCPRVPVFNKHIALDLTVSGKFLVLFIDISTHSAPEQWPREKITSTPKINPNESVLLLYTDI